MTIKEMIEKRAKVREKSEGVGDREELCGYPRE